MSKLLTPKRKKNLHENWSNYAASVSVKVQLNNAWHFWSPYNINLETTQMSQSHFWRDFFTYILCSFAFDFEAVSRRQWHWNTVWVWHPLDSQVPHLQLGTLNWPQDPKFPRVDPFLIWNAVSKFNSLNAKWHFHFQREKKLGNTLFLAPLFHNY